MRNLKEMMKDDGGVGICSNLCCHGLNCICSFEQSAFIAVGFLITNVWTFLMKDGAMWMTIAGDSISNVLGK